MVIRKIYIVALCSLLLSILVTGCSSSGGDSPAPTDPNTVFQLFPSGFFTAGYSETYNLTGTDTLGGTHKAVFSLQTQAPTTFLGQPAIPVFVQVQITNTSTGAVVSNSGNGYYSTSPTDRRYLGYSDSTTTTVSAVTSTIPQTAKIGDIGVVGTYTDNTGNVDTQSWRLDDGFNGNAKLVELSNEVDQFGTLDTSSTTTHLINTSGNRLSITLVLFFNSLNATLTLTGS
jgi:hypothetical protein